MKRKLIRIFVIAVAVTIGLGALAVFALAGTYVYLQRSLPTVAEMRNVELQVPLRVYARNGQLIAQIGAERRIPVSYEEIPEIVKQAFIAAEDDRFFQHGGFDYAGVLRAALVNMISGRTTQGASTITMQAARNMFLNQERTLRRKLQEVFLTTRLESEFTKEQILALYLNVIFFGQRSYGVSAAAETYFGKSLDQLSLAEAATLARIPQAPTKQNPIVNPEGAAERRGYVLRRMRELGFIDAASAERAAKETLLARVHSPLFEVEAPYIGELVRLEVIRRFGPEAPNQGYKVTTTIDSRLQAAANRALRIGLLDYDRRHGWRGATSKIEIGAEPGPEELAGKLDEFPTVGTLLPAVVVSVGDQSARAFTRSRGFVNIDWGGMSWARTKETEQRLGPEPKRAADILARGDVVYVLADEGGGAQLMQPPEVEGALVALDPNDGGIAALVGGFDYFDTSRGKFNRVTQAERQPGSAFKPFLYSAALENGFTASSVIMDAPIIIEDSGEEESWRPENSSGEFYGPTRLREALVRSRNLVSIRILQEMGTKPVIAHAARFGFDGPMPANLTLALGTQQVTPLKLATGFATFANGGYLIEPYFIERIQDPQGKIVYRAAPATVCENCGKTTGGDESRAAKRVISPQNDYLMVDMMRDVIRRGTGKRALALKRKDIAGKTGTSNDARDTWFNGFTRDLVATVWVGFDNERPLGEGEEGSRTAVPIWVDFMREALKGVPERLPPMPDGLVEMRVSATTGAPATAEDSSAIFETFMINHPPTGGVLGGDETTWTQSDPSQQTDPADPGTEPASSEPLF